MEILLRGGRIRMVDNTTLYVKSQTSEAEHKVQWASARWSCDCEQYLRNRRPCAHIFAANLFLDLPQIVLSNGESSGTVCKFCGSSRVVPRETKYNKSGSVQMFWCKECDRRFVPSVTGTRGGVNAAIGLIALDLHFKKCSVRDIRDHLFQVFGVSKPASTIQFWITKLNRLVIEAAESLTFEVGDRWLADEFFVKVKGNPKFLWNVLDFESRRLIASLLTDRRGAEEAEAVIKEAIRRAGKIPKDLTHDGLKSYGEAIDDRLADLKLKHTANVALRDKQTNNNRIESFHSTLRAMVKPHRGTKSPEKFGGYAAYYNFLKPSTINGELPVGGRKTRLMSFIRDSETRLPNGAQQKSERGSGRPS